MNTSRSNSKIKKPSKVENQWDIKRLERKTKPHLQDLAKDLNLKISSTATKRDIIEKITGIRPKRKKPIKFWFLTHPSDDSLVVLHGDTYIIREELKNLGCIWDTEMTKWVAPCEKSYDLIDLQFEVYNRS